MRGGNSSELGSAPVPGTAISALIAPADTRHQTRVEPLRHGASINIWSRSRVVIVCVVTTHDVSWYQCTERSYRSAAPREPYYVAAALVWNVRASTPQPLQNKFFILIYSRAA